MRTLIFLFCFFALPAPALAQRYELNDHLVVMIDESDTIVAINTRPAIGAADRVRLSARGVAKHLIFYEDDFYMVSKNGDLLRLDHSRARLLARNLAWTLAIAGGLSAGVDTGLSLAGAGAPVAGTIPWVLLTVALVNSLPPAMLAHVPIFDGANLFTEKLAFGVESIFRTRGSNYELVFQDNRKNKLLGTFPRPRPTESCEIRLSRLW